MLKLQTYFVYGLNKRLDDDLLQEESHVLVGSKFLALPIKFRAHVHKLETSLCGSIFTYI